MTAIDDDNIIQFVDALEDPSDVSLIGSDVTDVGVLRLIAERRIENLYLPSRATDLIAPKLGTVDTLRTLSLAGSEITDKGLEYLAMLHNIEYLYMPTFVSDIGLKSVGQLITLKLLSLLGSDTTDAGVDYLYR